MKKSKVWLNSPLSRSCALVLVALLWLFCPVDAGPAEYSNIEQIQKRMNELTKEVEGCGMDQNCLQQKMNELQDLSQKMLQMQGIQPPQVPPPGSKSPAGLPSLPKGLQEEMARAEATSRAVEKALEAQRGDPCYPVKFTKEVARRTAGSDLPWIVCIPVRIYTTWDIREQYQNPPGMGSGTGLVPEWEINDNFPGSTDRVHYIVEEDYTGYLELTYDQETIKRIEQFTLVGPVPEDQGLNVRIKEISATLTGSYLQSKGLWSLGSQTDTVKYETFTPSDPSSFRVAEGGLIECSPGQGEARIKAPEMELIEEKIVKDPRIREVVRFLSNLPSEEPSRWGTKIEDFSVEDVLKVSGKGELVKEFPIPYEKKEGAFAGLGKRGVYELMGNWVAVRIVAEEPGGLTVMPGSDLSASGPDRLGRFHPSSRTYTLRNTGKGPIKFMVSKAKKWISLTETTGRLGPGETTKVTVAVDDTEARKLPEQIHKDTVSFVNATNGRGNTSRTVTLDVGEEQTWQVALSGQETDDLGGKLMALKMEKAWKSVTVDYGVRFDYKMAAEFTIKKRKGSWKYMKGTITEARLGEPVMYFDPEYFFIKKYTCLDCSEVPQMKGQSLGGEVTGDAVSLFWPSVRTRVIVENKLKLDFEPKDQVLRGYSANYFASEEFFDRASGHRLPLKEGALPPIHTQKKSAKDQFRPSKHKRFNLSYFYVMKRLK